jgi:hypothetical protein
MTLIGEVGGQVRSSHLAYGAFKFLFVTAFLLVSAYSGP